MTIAKSVEDTILGEAKAGNFQDMVAIASVIDNRAAQTKTTYQDVVAAPGQFDAYGKALPPGVSKYRDMAKKAVDQVKAYGPVHSATFYATPAAAKGLPKGLALETKTDGHQFYSDPQARPIATAQGYKTPDPSASRAPANIAGDPSDTLYSVTDAAAPMGVAAPSVSAPAPVSAPSITAQTTPALTGTTAYGFPTYSPTVDLEDRPLSPVKGVADYNPGAKRSVDPTTGVVEATQAAVTKSFGPGYSVGIVSGQEPRGLAAIGSKQNHPGGYAIDFDVIDPMGNPVDVKDPQVAAAMKGVHTSLAATGRGIGYGEGYMAPGRTHVGTPPGSSVVGWGKSLSKDSMDPGLYSELSMAKTTGVALPDTGPFAAVLGQTTAAMPGRSQIDPRSIAAEVSRAPMAPVGAPRSAMPGRSQVTPTAPPTIEQQITAMTPAIAMPTALPTFAPVAPAAVPAALPATVPVPTPRPGILAPPPVAPTFAPRSAPSAPAMAPAMPTASAADVWGGKAMSGTATNGNQVSRNPDGSVSMTSSKYGYTEVDGQYRGKVDPNTVGRVGQVSIPGPLGNVFGRTAPSQQQAARGPSMRGFGPAARSAAGSVAGGMVGGLLGPLGSVVGAAIGRNLAMGKTALGKNVDSFGWGLPTATQARSAFAQGFQPGLGFPTAPIGNSSQGGLTSFGQEAARGDHGGQAQSAANSPGRGLY